MNKNISITIISFLVIFIIIFGVVILKNQETKKQEDIDPIVTNSNQTHQQLIFDNVTDANNYFALELYSKVNSQEKNIFISPYSMSSALTMTYEGAKGETAEEMRKTLHLPEDINKVRSDYLSIYSIINNPEKDYELNTANSIWAQKEYPFKQDFFESIKQYYDGEITNLDFIKETEQSRQTINTWVENKTNQRIKNLIPKNKIDSFTRLILTNTIYFKANWSNTFDSDSTRNETFNLDTGEQVETEIMHKTSYYNYAEDNTAQILEMDYINNDISMLVILPKENINAFEGNFNIDKLESLKQNMNNQRVSVSFPKFKIEENYKMKDTLKELGMIKPFNPTNADFSGMTNLEESLENLYISKVLHKTFIEFSESGTEAAAATAVIVGITGIPPVEEPKEFKANKPFIYIIQEKSTGTILFIGKLNNPML